MVRCNSLPMHELTTIYSSCPTSTSMSPALYYRKSTHPEVKYLCIPHNPYSLHTTNQITQGFYKSLAIIHSSRAVFQYRLSIQISLKRFLFSLCVQRIFHCRESTCLTSLTHSYDTLTPQIVSIISRISAVSLCFVTTVAVSKDNIIILSLPI